MNGSLTINGRMFQCAGNTLYELFAGGTFTVRGLIGNDGKPVSMAASQPIAGSGSPQLAVISNGQLFVLNLSSNQLSIPNGFAGTPFQIVYVDGFYVMLNTNGQFQYSAALDATTWPGIETEATTSYPDQTTAIASVHRQLFTLSLLKGTTYYNAGDNPIPFDEVSGGDFEQGTESPWSLVPLDNTLFFIGANKEGAGIAWRLNGYTPQRISNHAIEYAWSKYSTIADVICYGYQDQGHTFYVCYFPTANHTWVYDVATQKWHEREFWNASTGQRSAHLSCSHAYCFGMHIVADWSSGNVNQMSINLTTDAGGYLIKRERAGPNISNEDEWMFFQQLQIIAETGLQPSQLLNGTATPTVFTLEDANGNLWNVSINDLGIFLVTPAAFASGDSLFLTDPSGATTWRAIVVPLSATSGEVKTTEVIPTNTAYPQQVLMYSQSGGSQWRLSVTNVGQIQTQFVATVYRNPQMLLRWSNDSGHTWTPYLPMDAGKPGNYKARCLKRRLGHARNRIFKVQVTDPIAWRIIDAYLKGTGFTPTERLTDRARKMA